MSGKSGPYPTTQYQIFRCLQLLYPQPDSIISGASTDSTSNKAPSKRSLALRSRVVTACDQCTSRKVKCTGEWPCKRCQEAFVICTYQIPKKKSRSLTDRSSRSIPPSPSQTSFNWFDSCSYPSQPVHGAAQPMNFGGPNEITQGGFHPRYGPYCRHPAFCNCQGVSQQLCAAYPANTPADLFGFNPSINSEYQQRALTFQAIPDQQALMGSV